MPPRHRPRVPTALDRGLLSWPGVGVMGAELAEGVTFGRTDVEVRQAGPHRTRVLPVDVVCRGGVPQDPAVSVAAGVAAHGVRRAVDAVRVRGHHRPREPRALDPDVAGLALALPHVAQLFRGPAREHELGLPVADDQGLGLRRVGDLEEVIGPLDDGALPGVWGRDVATGAPQAGPRHPSGAHWRVACGMGTDGIWGCVQHRSWRELVQLRTHARAHTYTRQIRRR